MNTRAKETVCTIGIVLLGAACGQSDLSQAPASSGEPIQGEPIESAVVQGEPIVPMTALEPALNRAAEATTDSMTLAVNETEKVNAVVTEATDVNETETPVVTDGVGAEVAEVVPVVTRTLTEADLQEIEIEVGNAAETVETEIETVTGAVLSATETVSEVAVEGLAEAEELSLSDKTVDETIRELETLRLARTEGGGEEPGLAPTRLDDGSLDISFERLASFDYEMPEDLTSSLPGEGDGASNQIPDAIRELNDQAIALKGFMLPLKVEEGLVTEMLIMRDQSMCCYGTVPKINEWVSVRMDEGKGVKPVMDQAVTLFGKLKVGEIRENGYLVGIYEMDGDRMDGPTDL